MLTVKVKSENLVRGHNIPLLEGTSARINPRLPRHKGISPLKLFFLFLVYFLAFRHSRRYNGFNGA